MSITLSDILGIISIVIALIGFGITIRGVNKAKALSTKIKGDLERIHTVADFSSALSCMLEIKNLHRSSSWQILPDKYSALRKMLIIIKETNPDIDGESKSVIQGAIATLSSMEQEIEELNFKKGASIDIPRLNRTISKQTDKLQPVLIKMQNGIGG